MILVFRFNLAVCNYRLVNPENQVDDSAEGSVPQFLELLP